jgi:hypothetical protein
VRACVCVHVCAALACAILFLLIHSFMDNMK